MKNELRIGNFISRLDLGSGIPRTEQVLELLSKRAVASGPCRVIVLYEDIKPIPLTEEWLRKFNAESYFTSDPQETQASKVFKFGDVKIHMCNEDVEEFMFESFEFIKIKTVHQLQNLHFALTGTELTYENKTEYLP